MNAAVVIALAAAGTAVLIGAAALRQPRVILWGLAALAGAYALWLVRHHDPQANVAAPLFAAGLLSCAEVAFAVARRGTGRPLEPARDAGWLAGTALASVAVSAIVLLAATVEVGRSVLLTLAGTAAVVATITLLRVAFRR